MNEKNLTVADAIKKAAKAELLEPNAELPDPKVSNKRIPDGGFKLEVQIKEPEDVSVLVVNKQVAIDYAIQRIGNHSGFEVVMNELKHNLHKRTPHTKGGASNPKTGETLHEKKFRQAGEVLLAVVGAYFLEASDEQPRAVELRKNTNDELHYLNWFINHFQFAGVLVRVARNGERGTKGNPPNAYRVHHRGNTEIWQALFKPLIDLAD